jgi:tetratricopeptide (TPR) repeat protein
LVAPIAGAQTGDPCRLGAAALERREPGVAEKLLRQCVTAQPSLQAYLMLCAAYQMRGKAADLAALAEEGLKRFPAEKRFYLTAGSQAGRDGRFERAIKVLEEAHRRWPEDEQVRGMLASSHLGRGKELLDAGENLRAEGHLRRAAALAPGDAEARLNLGRALHNLSRFTEAVAEFDYVIENAPNLELAHFHRGLARYSMGEFDAAAADLGVEIERNPDYAPSFWIRGQARAAVGAWQKALEDLDLAVRSMPDHPKAHHARGRCLSQLGRSQEAEAAFRRAMELDPADPAPVHSLVRLLLQGGRQEEAQPLAARAAELSRKQRSAAPGEVRYRRP